MLIAFHKPYGVLSQFTSDGSPNRTLAEFGFPPQVYAIGRLDADSEGLLLLSDEKGLNSILLDPSQAHERCYLVQVEGVPDAADLQKLASGIRIADYTTRPCKARYLDPQPEMAPREPPIRVRKTVADCWIELSLHEGKNRQVRRMTAAVGHPTLRLIRHRIGAFELGQLPVGKWRELGADERGLILDQNPTNSKKAGAQRREY